MSERDTGGPRRQKRNTAATSNDPRKRGDKSVIKRAVAPDASARVQEVVELTLQGHTTTEIAHRTGMSHTAIRNIKQRADFREGFSLAMDERREAFRRKIDASVGAALATLIASMARADRWRDKNDAANSILDRAGIARITKTEAKVEGGGALAELMAGACETDD